MSLIFDGFPGRRKAEKFVAAIEAEFGLKGHIFDNAESASEHDPFPFKLLGGPIVHIDRAPERREIEQRVIERVNAFSGNWAGT